ncbi:hypothetical protein HK104_008216 [Borealophlyctis nickersoniae]|nr:hypothetical protein HK104_008216 [Borealophlyctis nickersoniae]
MEQDSIATGSTLFGSNPDDLSERLAKRLATKLKIQVFVSFNVPSDNEDLVAFAERRLAQCVRDALSGGEASLGGAGDGPEVVARALFMPSGQ